MMLPSVICVTLLTAFGQLLYAAGRARCCMRTRWNARAHTGVSVASRDAHLLASDVRAHRGRTIAPAPHWRDPTASRGHSGQQERGRGPTRKFPSRWAPRWDFHSARGGVNVPTGRDGCLRLEIRLRTPHGDRPHRSRAKKQGKIFSTLDTGFSSGG